jgi:hypothetical protein
MLWNFWQRFVEFVMRFIHQIRSNRFGSPYGRHRFGRRFQEIRSSLITGADNRLKSGTAKIVLLPNEPKAVDRNPFLIEKLDGSRSEFQNLIEVSYVEGEFLS